MGWDLFYNFTGSRVLLEETHNDGLNGQPYFAIWKYRITNGKSPLGRLSVYPHRNYEGYGFYQINSKLTHSLRFKPREDNQSTLPSHLDQAGGAKDNQYTDFIPRPPCPVGLPQYSVNTALLNLVIEDMDFGCQSHGLDESLRRIWNMRPGISRMFGNGWTFAFESTLLAEPLMSGGSGDVTLKLGSGQEIEYRVTGTEPNGSYLTTVHYTRATAGLGPILSASIGIGTDTGIYTLIDKTAKLTYNYEIADYQIHDGAYQYRLTSITDRNDNTLTLAYDLEGRLVTLTDSSGRKTEFTYGGERVTLMKTFDGRSASYQYDARGNLTQSIDLLGNVITYAYDDKNYPLTMTVAGKTTSFAYATNANGDRYVSAVTEPDGKVRKYAFVNQSDTTTTVTEPVAGVTYYSNANGRTTAINNPLNHWSRVDYNAQWLPSRASDPLGHATAMEYDANGNLTKLTDPAGKSTAFTYDVRWNLTSVTDALGQKTTYAYDSHDNLISETSPLGRTTAYIVDDKGQVTQITRPDGSRYAFTYDVHGNLTGLTDPLGHAAQFTFDAQGLNLASTTDALGHSTGYTFDANRRLTAIKPPDGTQWQSNHDCCSLTSIKDGAGNTTTFQRDNNNRLTGVTDPLSGVFSFSYNPDGDLITATDPLGHATQTGYDKAHRPVSLTNPMGGKVQLGLDAAGNLTSLTDERGKVTRMTYDSRDQLLSMQDPLGQTTASYTRDALGRIHSILNARGDITTLSYDADGRLTEKSYNLNPATTTTYTWGLNNELASVRNAYGIKTFSHDAAGWVTRVGYPDGKTTGTTYDAAGNILSVTYTDGLVVNYTYDALNRVIGVSFAGNTLSLGYDEAGNLVSETRSNGTQTAYGYDGARQLVRVSHQRGAAVIADLNYSRNSAGLITQENGTWPLSPAHPFEDATVSHNDANAIVTWNADAFTHDADGNLTGITGSRRFAGTYDPENRLTGVTWNDGTTTTYVYDGLGYRVQTQSANGTSNLYHDSAGQLLDRVDPSQALTHYIYADGRLIASGSDAQGYVFYHFDKTGNTLALTDTTGQVVGAYAYDSFGKVVAHTGLTTLFTYVGAYGVIGLNDNLFFMQNRFYDANMGRFIQRDPIGFSGGQSNLYAYVGNDPVAIIDPIGLAKYNKEFYQALDYISNFISGPYGVAVNGFKAIHSLATNKKGKGDIYACKEALMAAACGWIGVSAGYKGNMIWFIPGLFGLSTDVAFEQLDYCNPDEETDDEVKKHLAEQMVRALNNKLRDDLNRSEAKIQESRYYRDMRNRARGNVVDWWMIYVPYAR